MEKLQFVFKSLVVGHGHIGRHLQLWPSKGPLWPIRLVQAKLNQQEWGPGTFRSCGNSNTPHLVDNANES